jgi:uncharacterized protein (DUF58 family)
MLLSAQAKNRQADKLVDSRALARIKDLPLLAKTLAQGVLLGLHGSMARGTGIEFSQFRAYEPGDAPGKIDWKLFARSDKYFIREAERESNINVWLVLDSSASMLQAASQTDSQRADDKLDYARTLLATLGYLAQQQGDAVGLLNLNSTGLDYLPALSGPQHWRRTLIKLAQIQGGGHFPELDHLDHYLAKLQDNAIVIVVSDFYQHNQEISAFMRRLNPAKTEIIAVQLESDEERDFPFKGLIRFFDVEKKQPIQVQAEDVKARYLDARQHFNQQLETALKQAQIEHLRVNIDRPMADTLWRFLRKRQTKR